MHPIDSNIAISKKYKKSIIIEANKIIEGDFKYFNYHKYKNSFSTWFFNPFNKLLFTENDKHWSSLNDFNKKFGDIKIIWDISRFNWIGTLGLAYVLTNEIKYIDTINLYIKSWLEKNSINIGPNWKCGQETSIRALNIFLTSEIIGQNSRSKSCVKLLEFHLNRIKNTVFYAKAQDNNHVISESTALYLISYILGANYKISKYYSIHKKGKKLLENSVNRLVMSDGSFSQHSIVYHRMVLDLLNLSELFRQKWSLKPFSKPFYAKIKKMIFYYSSFIDVKTGDAPNFGANDGTYLFNYINDEYRDFRPTLVLSSALFKVEIDKKLNTNNIFLKIFNIKPFIEIDIDDKIKLFDKGGIVKLPSKNGMLFFRIPKYKFRPVHSDALHVDVWESGINWIKDSGSYSYGISIDKQNHFNGTKGHSTIEFDDRNQMPRISRFLFSNWLSPKHFNINYENNKVSSSYIDWKENLHYREIEKLKNGWRIIDKIKGNHNYAIQRWLLEPSNWKISGSVVCNNSVNIEIHSEYKKEIRINKGYESRYYMNKVEIPVLEIMFNDSLVKVETKITFN